MDDDGFLLLFMRILLLENLPGFLHQPSRILEDLYCNEAEQPVQGKTAFNGLHISIQLNLPISVNLDPTYLYQYPSSILPIVPQEKTNNV